MFIVRLVVKKSQYSEVNNIMSPPPENKIKTDCDIIPEKSHTSPIPTKFMPSV